MTTMDMLVDSLCGSRLSASTKFFHYIPCRLLPPGGWGPPGGEFVIAGRVSSKVRFANLGPTLIRGFQDLEVAAQLLEIVSGVEVGNVHDETSRGEREM
jgi:hypothetical protein